MYQLVQSVATNKKIDEKEVAPNSSFMETLRKDKAEQRAKKGWRNAETTHDISTSNGIQSPNSIATHVLTNKCGGRVSPQGRTFTSVDFE